MMKTAAAVEAAAVFACALVHAPLPDCAICIGHHPT
jgi:hypothetical protein